MIKAKKWLALAVTFAFAVNSIAAITVSADSVAQVSVAESGMAQLNTAVFDYNDFLEIHKNAKSPKSNITVLAEDFISLSGKVEFKKDCVTLQGENAAVKIPVEVEKEGLYNLAFDYVAHTSNFSNIAFSMLINDKQQFSEMEALTLDRPWKDIEEPPTDSRGNQVRPNQEQITDRIVATLDDPEGRYNAPLSFYLNEGVNEITITTRYGGVEVYGITFYNNEKPQQYSDLLESYKQKGYDFASNKIILLEAEDYFRKSSSSILSDSDKRDSKTSPSDPVKQLYNIISGSRYSNAGDWLEWKFTPEETGLYYITFRARQAEKSGFVSNRRLLINGEVLFDGCDQISFPSNNNWYHKTMGTDDENYAFYFEAGNEYVLRLEIIPGVLSETSLILDDCIFDLNELYRSVVMIAGTNPDKYRDYKLHDEIPEYKTKIKNLIKTLKEQEEFIMSANAGKSGSALTAIRSLITRLEIALTKSDTLAKKISSFKSDIESLSAWNMDVKKQPLDLDYIAIHSEKDNLPQERANIFQNLWFEVRRLFASFMDDYGVIGDFDEKTETITAWMAAGRDQMNVFENLVTNKFTPNYGVQVKVSLVTTGISEAIMAGKAPDAIFYMGSDSPVSLASRGALEELSKLPDYDEVASWFYDSAMIPLEYKGGYYGIPLSQSFNMMFVRTDIFEELKLEIPNTWSDVYKIAAILQRQNMEVGIPSTFGMYGSLLMQNGGSVFADSRKATGFDTENAKEAFETWTSFYSEYGFPVTFDLYNRFRSGEMPIGIAAYSFYTQLEQMAPEISGRWKMVPMPGVMKSDGSIDRSMCVSASTGISTAPGLEQSGAVAVIIKDSKHKDSAWKLVKWFAGSDIQVEYALGVESALGPLGRYTPANIKAFEQMPWTKEQKDLLLEQWSQVVMIPEMPGNYAVARGINNAFRRTIYDNENPVNMLHKYNIQINRELERKYKEFYS